MSSGRKKRRYWFLLAIPLLLIVAWRSWSPADLRSCLSDSSEPGYLSAFIRDYFERNNRIDWRDMDNRFDVLSTSQGQKIASNPQTYACEALQILQSPGFSQSEKIYTTALMFHLPIGQYMGFMDRSHQLYTEAKIDREVMILVLQPRGTAINYWWLPTWRERFNRDAAPLLDGSLIRQVLSGRYWFDFPGNGF
ncbi:hypothetical protein [Pseudomonas frederiksbergensis]|uniref:hypothetical protein n=1 Tax=Pseudomonas frederiksbergensis TaxID=104087 RepID=UPI003D1EBCD4